MAEEGSRASMTGLLRRVTGPTFWRLGRWGVAAGAAVSLAYFVASSDLGLRRMATAFAIVQGLPPTPSTQPRDDGEVVRLSESLRRLTNDRDRLLARLETLERNLDDLTGSVERGSTTPRVSDIVPSSPPEPATPVPQTGSVTPLQQSSVIPPTQNAAPDSASTTPVNPTTKVDFGIDLGSAPTVEGLRSLWTSAKNKHAKLLEGLRPIIALRENAKPGSVELRLVAGPLASAALAARLCVVIITAGTVCQPAVYDGQQLAMR